MKKNSEGKNLSRHGFKYHLAVGTKSQYILQYLFSSDNLNDGKAAISLLKGVNERLDSLNINYATMDAGHDYVPINEYIYRMGAQWIIDYNKKHETLKYTRPSQYTTCPLAHDSLFQKVYKVKITSDLRKYSVPARGSLKWKQFYKVRSVVERVNAYLKGDFLLNHIYHRTGKKTKLHVDFVQLAYNAFKLAIDRLK